MNIQSLTPPAKNARIIKNSSIQTRESKTTGILVISTFPPTECGIATYSEDLIRSLKDKFKDTFNIISCPIIDKAKNKTRFKGYEYKLNTFTSNGFDKLKKQINLSSEIQIVMIQHEFGLFYNHEIELNSFLQELNKTKIVVFHTVLPNPNPHLLNQVINISKKCNSLVVMTQNSANLLKQDYHINQEKINIIHHGTHLVPHESKMNLKEKYRLANKFILSTFGLISSGKSIETTLYSLPMIIEDFPNTLFLIIGKTHPSILQNEGDIYREKLEMIIKELHLETHVKFINEFLPLPVLLEYLQLTDIYLFTSKDQHQAVSGTFAYALSCGCPIISTPIPHAKEILTEDTGVIIDFENSEQLAEAVINLLTNEKLRQKMGEMAIQKIAYTAWENSALLHAKLFNDNHNEPIKLEYKIPKINLDHLKKMTTSFGILQFSNINMPSKEHDYTVDDNSRALIALSTHFKITRDEEDLRYIEIYVKFIAFCQQENGNFLNYVSINETFTAQNNETNLDDSNGRAIWALGHILSLSNILPVNITDIAYKTYKNYIPHIPQIHSTRSISFIIKGIYNRQKNITDKSKEDKKEVEFISMLAEKLLNMYKHEANENWNWYESYLTYANAVIPEAMLCAYLATNKKEYKETAISTFDFLLSKTFVNNRIKLISNQEWLDGRNGSSKQHIGGEQPIDVAYTILALNQFNEVFAQYKYYNKIKIAFEWFLGNNHLNQIVYNPCTGGCYDGIEENNVNLNQGAESTVSYLLSRLVLETNNERFFKQINI